MTTPRTFWQQVKTGIWHPFLFGAYSILFLLSHNVGEMAPSEILLPWALLLALSVVLLIVLKFVFGNYHKSAVWLSVFIMLFFSYGHIYNMIENKSFLGFEIGRHRFFSLLYISILVLCFVALLRTRSDLLSLTGYLNVLSLILVAMVMVPIVQYETQAMRWDYDKTAPDSSQEAQPPAVAKALPDIYYIIPDAYARHDVLGLAFNYDNTAFVEQLRGLGFYVAEHSRSNYAMTFLSIASSLNMDYLDEAIQKIGPDGRGRKIPDRVYQDNKTLRFLKLKGYKINQFASRWGPTNRNPFADKMYKKGVLLSTEFISTFLGTTWLQPLSLRTIENDARGQVLYTLDTLAQITEDPDPTFTFVHLLVPHTPLFDKEGGPLHLDSFYMGEQRVSPETAQNYLDQISYLNTRLIPLLKVIIEKSDPDPIIIVQADHGPPIEELHGDNEDIMKKRMGILNAYYFPDAAAYSILYDSITPVNSFRLIFNHYFNAGLEPLDDVSHFSTYERPYDILKQFRN